MLVVWCGHHWRLHVLTWAGWQWVFWACLCWVLRFRSRRIFGLRWNFARISSNVSEKFLCTKYYTIKIKVFMFRTQLPKTKLKNCCWCGLQSKSSIYINGRLFGKKSELRPISSFSLTSKCRNVCSRIFCIFPEYCNTCPPSLLPLYTQFLHHCVSGPRILCLVFSNPRLWIFLKNWNYRTSRIFRGFEQLSSSMSWRGMVNKCGQIAA